MAGGIDTIMSGFMSYKMRFLQLSKYVKLI